MKPKKHIDDYNSIDEIEHLSINELKSIAGTEGIEFIHKKIQNVIKKFESISFISTNYNWFIAPSMKMSKIKNILKNYQNEIKVDAVCIKYFTDNLSILIDILCTKYPNRRDIIYEAYIAHLNKNYYSSVVLFLTQIDGISNDLMSNNFFIRKEWKTISLNDDIKAKIAYLFLKSYFDDECNEAPIKHTESKRNRLKTNHINRHQVLHGEIVDFNTEINSLKVFSLLVALTENLEWIKEQLPCE